MIPEMRSQRLFPVGMCNSPDQSIGELVSSAYHPATVYGGGEQNKNEINISYHIRIELKKSGSFVKNILFLRGALQCQIP